MSALPPEIWLQIFRYACVDNGSTGCALSRVSQRFRELAWEARFQSVCVDMDGMFAFLNAVLNAPPRSVQIRYLDVDVDYIRGRDRVHVVWTNRALFDRTSLTFDHMLRMNAATLRSLRITHRGCCRKEVLAGLTLPGLTELCLCGDFPLCPPARLPTFPSLRHLRFEEFGDYPIDLFSRITMQAPGLTHLYMKPLRPSRRLYAELEQVLNPDRYPDKEPSLQFPPTLRNVFVETAIDEKTPMQDVFKAMADRLRAVSSETTQVVLEEKEKEKPFDC
ncbi:hypothetical protein BDZ89DRAFT_1056682 [Hymenopellis radicata]|nr:hypothetical protein BDZ89DRAFT_1056682 [Hymenopellis radicata]